MEIGSVFPATQAPQASPGQVAAAQTPPQAPSQAASDFFISPVLRFDSRSLTVIFQVRDSGSGDVVRQFPPEAVVERYRQDASTKPFVVTYSGSGSGDDGSGGAPADQAEGAGAGATGSGADAGVPGRPGAAETVNPLAGAPVDLVA